MNIEDKVTEAMNEHPTGCLLGTGKKSVSATFWSENEMPAQALIQNLLSGVAHTAISNGSLTKGEILDNLNKVLQ